MESAQTTRAEAQVTTATDPEGPVTTSGNLKVPQKTWWKDAGLRRLYIWMPVLFLGSTTSGYDGSLLNGLQTMNTWRAYFNNPTGDRLGLFTAILPIGGILALTFTSFLCDRYGRRWASIIAALIVVVGSVLQSLPMVNDGLFLAGRFLIGCGSNVSYAANPALITELAYPPHRATLGATFGIFWYVGAIIAAWTIFGFVNHDNEGNDGAWRVPVALQCVMPVVQLLALWFVPESPRWLCSMGRPEEALDILAKYHSNGDRDDAFVRAQLNEIHQTISYEKEVSAEHGWLLLVKTPGNRKRLLLIVLVAFFSQCSGNSLVSYYLYSILMSVGIESSYDQALINGAVTIWSFLITLVLTFFLMERVGRKTLFMAAGVGMLISFSIWTACSAVYAEQGNQGAGSAVIAMIFLFYGVAGFAWPGLTVSYSAEIMTFDTRAMGLAVSMLATSFASIFNQYVNPVGLEALEWRFYFMYIAILVIECLCIWFLFVETRGPTLEEIAELFDGPAAPVARVMEEKVDHMAEMDGDRD